MPITNCSECGHEVSTSASVCPHCGAPRIATNSATGGSPREVPTVPPSLAPSPKPAEPARKSSGKKWWFMGCGCLALIAIIAAALFTGAIGGLSLLAVLKPKVHLENFRQDGDVEMINGEMDAGMRLTFDLRSVSSDPQDVTVEMKVSCSEGQWTHRRKIHLEANETQQVKEFFAEPTVSATDIRSEAKIVTGQQ